MVGTIGTWPFEMQSSSLMCVHARVFITPLMSWFGFFFYGIVMFISLSFPCFFSSDKHKKIPMIPHFVCCPFSMESFMSSAQNAPAHPPPPTLRHPLHPRPEASSQLLRRTLKMRASRLLLCFRRGSERANIQGYK